MKLKKGFITHQSGDEQILVSVGGEGFSGLVRSNSTAAEIVNCLAQDTTEAAIVDHIAAEYDAPRQVIAQDVARILDTLRSIGALDEG